MEEGSHRGGPCRDGPRPGRSLGGRRETAGDGFYKGGRKGLPRLRGGEEGKREGTMMGTAVWQAPFSKTGCFPVVGLGTEQRPARFRNTRRRKRESTELGRGVGAARLINSKAPYALARGGAGLTDTAAPGGTLRWPWGREGVRHLAAAPLLGPFAPGERAGEKKKRLARARGGKAKPPTAPNQLL